jgi:DNA polymerase-3 subunit beta
VLSALEVPQAKETQMDVRIDQAGFARALRQVGRAVPAQPRLPVLHAVLLESGPAELRLTATDLGLAVTATAGAEADDTARVAVPGRLLAEFVGELPNEPVRLRLDAGRRRLRAECGRFTAAFATVDPDEFPALPTAEPAETLELDAARLRAAIDRVAFAAAQDDQRPVLSAVLFDVGDGGLTLVAADGFRLARARVADVGATARQLLVPARAVREFGRLLEDAHAARLEVLSDGRGVRLAVEHAAVFTRLVDGHFPAVEQVIPRSPATRATVDTAAFRQAMRVAAPFGGSAADARPIVLDAADGRLRLRARGADTGEAEGELPASVEGAPRSVALNSRLLGQVVQGATGARLEIGWSTPQTPVLVREAGRDDGVDLWVVMPMHDAGLIEQPRKEAT